MATIAEALSIAFAHHQRGEYAQAERIYRQIVAAEVIRLLADSDVGGPL